MRVLVTGGSGRIGGYVLRELLANGHTVASFGRNPPQVDGVAFVRGEIIVPEQMRAAAREQDAIIHLTAIPAPNRFPVEDLMTVNVVGTVNVLEAAVKEGVGKVVFASSGAPLGFNFQRRPMTPSYLPIDEDHPCAPQDEYGLSKLLGELACKSYTDAYGLRTICLRINANWCLDREGTDIAARSGFSIIRGFDKAEDLWGFYRPYVEDPAAGVNNLWAVTDYRDAARAFELAIEDDSIQHDVFFINADDTCSPVETPELLARFLPDVPLKTPLTGHASLFSYARAERLLGFRPRYTWRDSDFARWLKE